MRIVVGSRNQKKVAEIKAILSGLGVDVAPLPAGTPEVSEDGATFRENACRKASALAEFLKETVLADDSGLEVPSLRGLPGVHSARFAGEHGNDAKNIEKLLEMMKGIDDRRASFRCVIALAGPEGVIIEAEGSCTGTIGHTPRGSCGFGYDPVFVPDGRSETFAEISPEEKNNLSHRGRALETFKQKCRGLPLFTR